MLRYIWLECKETHVNKNDRRGREKKKEFESQKGRKKDEPEGGFSHVKW